MMKIFRSKRVKWLMAGILGLVLIAVVITGFGTGGGGLGDMGASSDRLITVGGEAITERDFTARLNRELDQARQQQPELDMAGFIRMGAFEQLLDEMAREKAQVVVGSKEGLSASKRMIDGVIAGIPAFKDAAGNFDERAFRGALAQLGSSEAQLRDDIRTQGIRRQMILPAVEGARMPDALMRHYATLLLETRTGAIAAVPIVMVGPGQEPTEAEIAAEFKARQARYMIPERRVLRYALFGRADVAAAAKASDAEIEAAYRAAAATYGPRDTRAVAQLTLPDQAAANALAAKVKAGKSFAEAAQEAGFAAGDIVRAEGTKAEIAGSLAPPVADAAFTAAQGTLVGPVRSPLGWHVARIEKAAVSPGKPLAAVRGELAASIEERKAAEALDALTARIEDAVSDASFDEIVRANKLQAVETQPVTAAGTAPGSDYQLPVEAKALLKAGFELGTDDDPQVETLTEGQRFALLAVSRIVEPAVPPLAQVRDQVKADLIRARSTARGKALTDRLVAQINAGTPIREALAKAGVALPPVQTVTLKRIDANRQGDKLPPPVKLLFSIPKGKARALPAPAGSGWFIVLVEQTQAGSPSELAPLLSELAPQFHESQRTEYAEQMTLAIERAANVKRNESAIARLKSRLLSGGAAAE